jgi:hypothetical protein
VLRSLTAKTVRLGRKLSVAFSCARDFLVVDESARNKHFSFCIHNMSRELGAEFL